MASVSQSDLTAIQGALTEGHAERLEDLRPTYGKIQDKVPFIQNKKENPGSQHDFPLVLTNESSVSYTGENGDVIDYTIGNATVYERAIVKGSEIYVIGDMPFKMVTAVRGGGKTYIPNAVETKIQNITLSGVFRLEDNLIYGRTPRAEIDEAVSDGDIAASGTTFTVTIPLTEWCPAMWLGMEGCLYDAWEDSSAASPTNATAALVLQKGGIDIPNRTLSFDCSASDVTALNALTTCQLFPFGARVNATEWNEAAGIVSLLSDGTTEVHGVSRDYSLWNSQEFDFQGSHSFSDMCAMVAARVPYGASGKMFYYCSPSAWNALMLAEAAGLRTNSPEYKAEKFTNGAGELAFKIMDVEVVPVGYSMLKEGLSILMTPKTWARTGSTDLTYQAGLGDRLVYALEGNNAIRCVLWSDQAIVCRRLGLNAIGRNVVTNP